MTYEEALRICSMCVILADDQMMENLLLYDAEHRDSVICDQKKN